jgi:hypothetical protein
VLLLHELPDGSAHVDWLIGRDPEGRQPLMTFRLERRIDRLEPGVALEAEHIGDHRPLYLDYEGRLDAAPGGSRVDRGAVRRLVRGRLVAVAADDGAWEIEVTWEGVGASVARIRLDPRGGTRWIARRVG